MLEPVDLPVAQDAGCLDTAHCAGGKAVYSTLSLTGGLNKADNETSEISPVDVFQNGIHK